MAWLLDDAAQIPGTKIRVGLDPLLGLVPGLGDVVSTGFSLYILYEASRLGIPRHKLAMMAGNIALDTLVGLVPLLGDVGDVFFRANHRNLRLMGIDPTR